MIAAPVPVPTTDGKLHLAYEVQVTNALDGTATLKSLSVKAGDDKLLTLAGTELSYWTRALGAGQTPTATLGPGQSGIVWLDVVLDAGQDGKAPVPTELTHTLVVDLSKPMPPLLPATMIESDVAPVTVSTRKPVAISPPLDGPRWLDANSCCDMTAHRMAMNPINGNLWAAERFAIDYVQLSEDGTIFKGDRSKPESYPYFGADIHAVADGPVVAVLDGLPEQIAGKSPTGLTARAVRRQPRRAGHRRWELRVLRPPQDRKRQGEARRSTELRSGDRQPRQYREHRRAASALPRDEHTGSVALQRLAVRLQELHARRQASPRRMHIDPLLTGGSASVAPGSAARDEKNLSPLVLDVMTYAAA